MNGIEGNAEYSSLKSLLQQWKLPHLMQHFLAQSISIEVLMMMKSQHIAELLQNFTCGDRIRFEYELEKWRYSIGNPLHHAREIHTTPVTLPMIMSPTLKRQPSLKDSETQTVPNESFRFPWSSQKNNSNDDFFNFQSHQLRTAASSPLPSPSVETSPIPAPPVSSALFAPAPAILSHSTAIQSKESLLKATSSKLIYSPRMRFSLPPIARDPTLNISPQQMEMRINAREILEKCSPRGPELIRLYETNKRFRPIERAELINLFALYFYENSIHLPVKLSHELERQILKIFPGEKLRDYRTEKRGKIYIRLSNIKNNRRRAREAKLTFLRDLKRYEQWNSDDDASKNLRPEDRDADDTEIMPEENSNSLDKPLEIYFDEVKQETTDNS